MVFKTLTKIWLETKCLSDSKQHMYILQLLGKVGLYHWKSFQPPAMKTMHSLTIYGKPLKADSDKQTLTSFHQKENESIVDIHSRLTLSLEK